MQSPAPPPDDSGRDRWDPPPQPGSDRSSDSYDHVPVSPLHADDPPKIGGFWLDARLSAAAAGVVYTGHDDSNQPAMIVLLSEGAAADAAARDRLAGVVNAMHIDSVLARGGQGQDWGRMARRFQSAEHGP